MDSNPMASPPRASLSAEGKPHCFEKMQDPGSYPPCLRGPPGTRAVDWHKGWNFIASCQPPPMVDRALRARPCVSLRNRNCYLSKVFIPETCSMVFIIFVYKDSGANGSHYHI
jgi:hypothetical protein